MRRFVLLAAAVLVAAAVFFVAFNLPPRHVTLPDSSTDASIPGIIHVHSQRSDGQDTIDEIAAAAARAGLKFVILTDHGDATRTPDAPAYRSGVLCLDAVEISTSRGHYIALDMPAAPYPLAGDARDVVEDVKRLGGFGVAAHPDSPKPELQWRDWTAPFDALEAINLDTAWRQRATAPSWRAKFGLATRLLTYPFRPAESIATLVRPSSIWTEWSALAARRRVMLQAGADVHAGIPSYLASFRSLSVRVRTERALAGDAAADARLILRAIRAGHSYSVLDGVATPPSFDFTATNARGTVRAGDEIMAGGPLTLRVRSNAPPAFTTTVWDGATVIASDRHEPDISVEVPEKPGVFRVEIAATGRTPAVPWIISNAIFVRSPEARTSPVERTPPASSSFALFDGKTETGWSVEQDPTSVSAFEAVETGTERQPALRFRFGLASGMPGGQVAALAVALPNGAAPYDRVTFTVRAERPMRLSVQLRATNNERWQRSVYVDTFNLERTVTFADMTPAGATSADKPPLAAVRALLFVVDTTNTKPGTSGRVWVYRPELQR